MKTCRSFSIFYLLSPCPDIIVSYTVVTISRISWPTIFLHFALFKFPTLVIFELYFTGSLLLNQLFCSYGVVPRSDVVGEFFNCDYLWHKRSLFRFHGFPNFLKKKICRWILWFSSNNSNRSACAQLLHNFLIDRNLSTSFNSRQTAHLVVSTR